MISNAVQRTNSAPMRVYYQTNTTNESFMQMHYYLEKSGRINNKFFLVLINPNLRNIDPRDSRLNRSMKIQVLRECASNYWYFLRECVRIPDQGGSANSGKKYKLHRGNLALNFCISNNWNVFAEFPRQHGKTIAIVCRYLWEFQFGTANSELMMINKKHDDSKLNLQRLKDIRDALPSYLQMKTFIDQSGKKIRARDSVEKLQHIFNNNVIKTFASARNRIQANTLGRGCSQPRQWYDEFAFIPYNKEIYLSATPAYKTASLNAQANGAPYGIIITTTPGDLTTEEGLYAYNIKESATNFNESWYDMSYDQITRLLSKNTNSSFIYIKYNYQQLGSDEKWFKEIVVEMNRDWAAIRREVLLEWSAASDNSPFSKEDLEIVQRLVKNPIKQLTLCNYYTFNVYEELRTRKYPPIIGVDVSGGFKRDSSAITIIDSKSTKVVADFNCNYISPIDLANVIYELVTKHMTNAVVNIERNGGFGSSVIAQLLKTRAKRNLFYEIKDKVTEERYTGNRVVRKTAKTKVYGLDSTKNTRDILMQILRERMEFHKDKFISPIIYKELQTLEVKKSGKIEHSTTGHDDQIFSYLMALYVWYEGSNIMENWGIVKGSLTTDEDIEKGIVSFEEEMDDIFSQLDSTGYVNDNVAEQMKVLNTDKSILFDQFKEKMSKEDEKYVNLLLSNPVSRKAYMSQFSMNQDEYDEGLYTIPTEFFEHFND